MNTSGNEIKIFSGNSNIPLASSIAEHLNIKLGDAQVTKFSDGEISVNINETVRGSDVFLIQSTSSPVNNNLMELLIMIDALKRASAGRITAVVPYYGYARQDRKAKSRDPITAKLVADLITTAGADRLLTMDLHASQIQGYFDIPVDHLQGQPLLSEYYRDFLGKDLVVASPDLGSVTRARTFANRLDCEIAIIDKRRPKPNVSEVLNIIGNVEGKSVIIVDDMIDTAGTLVNASKSLMDYGAKEVFAACTHAVFSGEAIKRIEESPIKELLILDTIQLPEEKKLDKIKIESVAEIFSKAIYRIFCNKPLSAIFD